MAFSRGVGAERPNQAEDQAQALGAVGRLGVLGPPAVLPPHTDEEAKMAAVGRAIKRCQTGKRSLEQLTE